MRFILIFGPHAVGKTTVGKELARLTGMKLLSEHMTEELAEAYFERYTSAHKRLAQALNGQIIESVLKNQSNDLIFTYTWPLNVPTERDYVERITDKFRTAGAEIYYVELEAPLEERIRRNRLKQETDNLEKSERQLKDAAARFRLNALKSEIGEKNYTIIKNSGISAEDAAEQIISVFKLPVVV